jgi:Uma2 family endonuclease
MAQLTQPLPAYQNMDLPPLEAGDHLDQKTFHERYKAMPEGFRAELIGGIVFVPSPLKYRHGRHHALVMGWLGEYEVATPCVEVLDGATVILGDESEPQPDAILIIDPRAGGQTRLDPDDYVRGAPELVVEVASSSESYDLYEKKRDYEQLGVQEYLVVIVRSKAIRWFARRGERFTELETADSIYRSELLPGLWLDSQALFAKNARDLRATLAQGLSTQDHQAFAKRLGQLLES